MVWSLPSMVRSMNHKHQPLDKWLPTSVRGVEFLTSVRACACVCSGFFNAFQHTMHTHGFPLVCIHMWAKRQHLFDKDFPQTSHTRCFFTYSISQFPCANILPHVYYTGIYSQVWNLCQELYYARKMYVFLYQLQPTCWYTEYQWQWLMNEPTTPR